LKKILNQKININMIKTIKSLMLVLALVFVANFASAQNVCCTKNGTNVLPEAGEFSIGIDAVPVLNYFGNFFNNSGNTAAVGFQQAGVITGSYMKTANTSYRGKLAINFATSTVDSTETQSSGVNVGAGILKYRGKTRLQGYYGAEVGLGISNGSVTFSGTETKAPSTLVVNARAFVGAQYFFAPKMSIGTEYGWGPGFSKSDDNSSFNLGVDNMGGAIYLSLFF
jgi:hypothetical protein